MIPGTINMIKPQVVVESRVWEELSQKLQCKYRVCPNWSTVRECKLELGCTSINFNNKPCRPVPTIRIYTVNRNRVDLCLQGSGDLRMCGSQTDRNTARILMFFTVLWQSFNVLSGIWCEFDVMCFLLQGGARLLGHALLLGDIRYVILSKKSKQMKHTGTEMNFESTVTMDTVNNYRSSYMYLPTNWGNKNAKMFSYCDFIQFDGHKWWFPSQHSHAPQTLPNGSWPFFIMKRIS